MVDAANAPVPASPALLAEPNHDCVPGNGPRQSGARAEARNRRAAEHAPNAI
jgi:hypothetical protein